MPAGFSVPYLTAEALEAVILREDMRDEVHPILRFFPRKQQRGAKIKVRRLRRKIGRVMHSTFGGRARPVRRGEWEESLYEPSVIKLFDTLTADDLILFADAESALGANDVSDRGAVTIAEANDRLRQIGRNLRNDGAEERHALCAGALQGSLDYQIEGGAGGLLTRNVSYGLTALTPPSTDWDNAGADIVTDLTNWITEFKNNNDYGLPPDAVIYNPTMWATYFLGNTEMQAWKKSDPELARGFLRMIGGISEADTEGRLTQKMFGLTWIPVEGNYRNVADDANVTRWATDKLTFLRVADSDMRWAMAFDPLQNPTAAINVEISEPRKGDDVKAVKATSFDNGLPVIAEPQFVQTVDVIP